MEYLLIFKGDEFEEFKRLALNDRYLSTFIGRFILEPTGWVTDLWQTEYCVVLSRIERLDKKSRLIGRMRSLGEAQDNDFQYKLRNLKRELDRLVPE